jgi:protein TonB
MKDAEGATQNVMSALLEGDEQLERELTPEPIAAPAAGSIAFHALLFGGILLYGVLGGLFHHNQWGSEEAGGAIEVNLTAALPLPSDHPPNDNVLATETPSEAPAEKVAKPQEKVEEDAIPIASKVKKQKDSKTAPKTQQHQPEPKQENRARFGEQAGSSTARAMQSQVAAQGPVSVNVGDFGSRFGYYVSNIERKMGSNWYKQVVDPRTPKGARAYILFTIHRDGSVSEIKMDKSSGVPTLDRSCLQAAQRVDTFGNLPAQYNQNTLLTSYYCEY